jgi:hypothetical protein
MIPSLNGLRMKSTAPFRGAGSGSSRLGCKGQPPSLERMLQGSECRLDVMPQTANGPQAHHERADRPLDGLGLSKREMSLFAFDAAFSVSSKNGERSTDVRTST